MKRREHTVTLKSVHHYGKSVPPGIMGDILKSLTEAAVRSVSMGFQGTSTASRGRRPEWFSAATDFRYLGHEGTDDTVLHFEAPLFGDAARDLYNQGEFWTTKPSAEDTGFDLLTDIIADVRAENEDSDRFDAGLLDKVMGVGRQLNGKFQEIWIAGRRHPRNRPAVVDERLTEIARRFRVRTPLPQRARVVGTLDMLRASTNSFGVVLENGQEVRGVLAEGGVEQFADLLKQEVLVLGKCVYRPSGRLLRLDAENVAPATGESKIWSRIPESSFARTDTAGLRKAQGPKSGLAAIIGQWPGDETDEEINAELAALS